MKGHIKTCNLGGSLWAALTLCLLAFLTCAPASAAAAENKDAVAVIIGNKNYSGSVPNVDFAHNDADAMKRFVIDVLGFREGNIIELLDATQAQMASAFGNESSHEAKLWSWVKQGKSDVVVFYSGHGVPGLRDQRGYLLPVDADPDTPEFNGYPMDLLYANLAKLKARSVTVYLDACFSGESPKGRLTRAASSIGLSHVPEKTNAGITVLTAAQGDQLASWDEEAKHGLFTRYLLEGLYGAADGADYGNGDGAVTLAEVRNYLDDEMTYAARRTYLREQQATIRGDEGSVLASLPEGGAAEPPQLVTAPEVVPLDQEMTATKNANLRAGPGTSHDKLGLIVKDAVVKVTGRTEDGEWYRVSIAGGRTGFVYGNLLAEKKVSPTVSASANYAAGKEAYERGDFDAAYRILLPLAEQGDINAQFKIGSMFLDGEGRERDTKEAFKWYRKAADAGYAEAELVVGFAFLFGSRVVKNTYEAAIWIRKAARKGVHVAQAELGKLYITGKGVPQNNRLAHAWLSLAADQGVEKAGKARDLLARKMTPAELSEAGSLARQWPNIPENLDSPGASLALAQELEEGEDAYRRGDYPTAFRKIRSVAEQGQVEAQIRLAEMYLLGRGATKSWVNALEWYRKAASTGHPEAEHFVGLVLLAGGQRVLKDAAEAAKWFRKAANKGFAFAQLARIIHAWRPI